MHNYVYSIHNYIYSIHNYIYLVYLFVCLWCNMDIEVKSSKPQESTSGRVYGRAKLKELANKIFRF